MPIPIIDNLKINSNLPEDTRMIASNSTNRDAILYKYDGLKVFQLDTRLTFIWNNPRYLSTGVTSSSWDISESTLTGQGTFNYLGGWDSTGFGLTGTSILSYPISYNEISQKVGIGDIPQEAFQLNSNYLTYSYDGVVGTSSMPFVIHKGVNTIIGDNWYWDNSIGNRVFDYNFSSHLISFKNGGIYLKSRINGESATMSDIFSISNIGSASFSHLSMTSSSQPNSNNGSIYLDSKFKVKEGNKWRNITDSYSTYTAIISQYDTSPPNEVSLLEYSIGSGTWSYEGVGTYNLTVTNGFITAPDIDGFCGPYTSLGVFFGTKISDSVYQIKSLDIQGGTETDNLLNETFIEIKSFDV